MKIAHFGATGQVGSRIVVESLDRGHSVTAIARTPGKLAAHAKLSFKSGDVNDQADVARLVVGHDAVTSSVRFQMMKPRALIAGMKSSPVTRLLVVGGAASLKVAPGRTLLDTPDFPQAYKAEATAGSQFLDMLLGEHDIDWTFLSPSAELVPGRRTGKFRLGKDQLLTDASGRSWISMEDFAVAVVDELEVPKHSRERFTVGY